MKKIRIFLCCSIVLLTLFSLAIGVLAGATHICRFGTFDPVVVIEGNSIVVKGCSTCGASFGKTYPLIRINLKNGATLDENNYSIPITEYANCSTLLKGTEDEIIMLFVGRGNTVYALSEKKPTETGDYSVFLSTKKLYQYYIDTKQGSYIERGVNKESIQTKIMTTRVDFSLVHYHSVEYYAVDEKLVAKCTKCGEIGSVTTNIEKEFKVGHFESSDVSLVYDGWSNLSSENIVVLYEGREEKQGDEVVKTEYALSDVMPSRAGFYTISVALKKAWENDRTNINKYRSNPVSFTIDDEYHKWNYTASGISIVAQCKYCDATARVVLDSSSVYENARQLDTGGLKQELFYVEDWDSYENIDPFSVIYDGKEIYDVVDKNKSATIGTSMLYRSTIAPEGSGNYVAYLAILKDPNDVTEESMVVRSQGMPFYIAGYSFSRCQVVTYGVNEIASFTKPSFIDGVYYVGTQSELLWCVYNQTDNMHISLTSDIVVNPITVTESGNISTGALTIYKWRGFGYDSRFSGIIEGNGHIIYGIYMPESSASWSMGGFICAGKNVVIKNLTIESSYFKTGCAGVFIGDLEVTDKASLENCNSIHNLVIAEREAGGLIGWLQGSRSTVANANFVIENCVNDSSVNGNNAGGIIGNTPSTENNMICPIKIYQCKNYGKITGKDFAAGIIGSFKAWGHLRSSISYCLNAGSINATSYAGGIVGELIINRNGGSQVHDAVMINININIGSFATACQNKADILAKTDITDYRNNYHLTLIDNYYSKTKNAYPASLSNAPEAIKLTTKNINNGRVCEILGHVSPIHYSNVVVAGCETDGSKDLCCATCGTILKTVKTSAHGHMYDASGKCIYCETKQTNTASLFSSDMWWWVGIIVVVLTGAGVSMILINKKRTAN